MIRFGTDGIRGPALTGAITEDTARRIGAAARRLGAPVFVARDPRPSGPALAAATCAGADAIDLGICPTSALASVVRAHPGSAGVMVTASHNPAADNGFKVLGPGGGKLDDEQIQAMEAWIASPATDAPVRAPARLDPTPFWLADVRAALPDLSVLAGSRLVVDLAGGAAAPMFEALRPDLPCDVEIIDTGEINAGGSEHPARLADAVVARGADFGLAVDGDADRCLLVDANGRIVPGDELIFVLARGLAVRRMAVTVMSSVALDASLPGVEIVRTPVGDRHLLSAWRAHGLPLAAEESGHVLLPGPGGSEGAPRLALPGSDGLLTGLRALCVAPTRAAWAALVAELRILPRRLLKVPVSERRPLEAWPEILHAEHEVSSWLGSPGRTFLRYSGTEPVLRILVEGADAVGVARAAERLAAVAERGP